MIKDKLQYTETPEKYVAMHIFLTEIQKKH